MANVDGTELLFSQRAGRTDRGSRPGAEVGGRYEIYSIEPYAPAARRAPHSRPHTSLSDPLPVDADASGPTPPPPPVLLTPTHPGRRQRGRAPILAANPSRPLPLGRGRR